MMMQIQKVTSTTPHQHGTPQPFTTHWRRTVINTCAAQAHVCEAAHPRHSMCSLITFRTSHLHHACRSW